MGASDVAFDKKSIVIALRQTKFKAATSVVTFSKVNATSSKSLTTCR